VVRFRVGEAERVGCDLMVVWWGRYHMLGLWANVYRCSRVACVGVGVVDYAVTSST
jgi:hypothetical protein